MSPADPLLVLVADAQVDLSPLTQRLWAQKIPHRVVQQQGKQCLYLADGTHLEQIKGWLDEWQQGELDQSDLIPEARSGAWLLAIVQAPLTAAVMLLFIAFFIWMNISPGWQTWLTLGQDLWPQQRFSPSAYFDIELWSFWRPTLLHFSFLHILMNMFWWWLLARRIEAIDGKLALLALLFFCGLLGNAAQWWYAGPAFGGASGVTLGLLAWVTLRQQRFKLAYQIPGVLMPVMVGWLLLTLMGDTLVPGLSGTAHGAHFGGLITGALLSLVWPMSSLNNAAEAGGAHSNDKISRED